MQLQRLCCHSGAGSVSTIQITMAQTHQQKIGKTKSRGGVFGEERCSNVGFFHIFLTVVNRNSIT